MFLDYQVDGTWAEVCLRFRGRENRAYLDADTPLIHSPDFLVPLCLQAAMRAGEPLELPPGVSERLAGGIDQMQDIYAAWEPGYRKIPVKCPDTRPAERKGSGVACFFSGGVDSSFTVARRPEVTHLIFLRRYADPPGEAFARMGKVARELGKELVTIDTNMYTFSPEMGLTFDVSPWLFAAAHLLPFRTVYIAASSASNYDVLEPSGAHPLFVGLYGSEGVTLRLDGCEVRRTEKVAAVSDNPLAMRRLQVCGSRTGGMGNCGKCEKCCRTMLNLAACGALERCETLPDRIDPAAVRSLRLNREAYRRLARDNLVTLQDREPELARALREALDRSDPLKKSRRRVKKLEAENEALKQRLLARHYKWADLLLSKALKVPGVKALMGK